MQGVRPRVKDDLLSFAEFIEVVNSFRRKWTFSLDFRPWIKALAHVMKSEAIQAYSSTRMSF